MTTTYNAAAQFVFGSNAFRGDCVPPECVTALNKLFKLFVAGASEEVVRSALVATELYGVAQRHAAPYIKRDLERRINFTRVSTHTFSVIAIVYGLAAQECIAGCDGVAPGPEMCLDIHNAILNFGYLSGQHAATAVSDVIYRATNSNGAKYQGVISRSQNEIRVSMQHARVGGKPVAPNDIAKAFGVNLSRACGAPAVAAFDQLWQADFAYWDAARLALVDSCKQNASQICMRISEFADKKAALFADADATSVIDGAALRSLTDAIDLHNTILCGVYENRNRAVPERFTIDLSTYNPAVPASLAAAPAAGSAAAPAASLAAAPAADTPAAAPAADTPAAEPAAAPAATPAAAAPAAEPAADTPVADTPAADALAAAPAADTLAADTPAADTPAADTLAADTLAAAPAAPTTALAAALATVPADSRGILLDFVRLVTKLIDAIDARKQVCAP